MEILLAEKAVHNKLSMLKGTAEEFSDEAKELQKRILHLRAASGRAMLVSDIADSLDDELEVMKERVDRAKQGAKNLMKGDLTDVKAGMANLAHVNPLAMFKKAKVQVSRILCFSKAHNLISFS
jgi:gas vesicle protein